MTIDLSKMAAGTKLLTRDGRRGRLVATDIANERSCIVAITDAGGREDAYICHPDGATSKDGLGPWPTDIVALAPETVRVRVILTPPAMKDGSLIADGYVEGCVGFTEEAASLTRGMAVLADEIVEVTLKEPAL